MVAGVAPPKPGGVAKNAGGSPASAGKSLSKSGRFKLPSPPFPTLSVDWEGDVGGAAQSKLGGGGGGGGAPKRLAGGAGTGAGPEGDLETGDSAASL